MSKKKFTSRTLFLIFDYTLLTILGLTCLLPMIHILAMSFSSSGAVTRGEVGLVPVEFTLQSYKYVLDKQEFWTATLVSLERVVLGVAVNMALTVLALSLIHISQTGILWEYGVLCLTFLTHLSPGKMALVKACIWQE